MGLAKLKQTKHNNVARNIDVEIVEQILCYIKKKRLKCVLFRGSTNYIWSHAPVTIKNIWANRKNEHARCVAYVTNLVTLIGLICDHLYKHVINYVINSMN